METADKEELLQVLDEDGNETNRLEQRSIVHKNGLFHNEVSCIVINNQKQILLQRRSKNKKSYPNCWGLFAGHVVNYDTIKEAITKEMREELVSEIKEENIFLLVDKIKNVRDDNKCFVTCFAAFINKNIDDIMYQKSEIDEVRWFSFDEFKKMVQEETGTIFKNNEYYQSIIAELEKLFSSKKFGKLVDELTEKIEELDEYGNPTSKIVTREFAHNYGIFHKSVSLFIINENDEILLQKRSIHKIRNGGLWDVSSSGHVRYGEDDITTIIRETYEETRYEINAKDIKFLLRYKEERKFNKKYIDKMWFNVYVVRVKETLEKDKDLEVEETRFFTVDELKSMMKTYKELAYKPEAYEAIIKYIEENKKD